VRLADVARVEDGCEEAETAGRLGGKPTVILAIRRQSGTNTVAVVRALHERLAEIGTRLPPGYGLEVVRDQSTYIEASVHTVQEHLVVGGLLAALVVWFFLRNWRSTVIAAIAIPTSIVSTFGLMKVLGLTLDMMTLLALTLAVGIVIDDAIVVLENIHRVMKEKRLSAMAAAREGTREIGLAVLATTLSLIAVFVPVAFMGGVVGRFLFSFGMTMAFSILVSLVVAFTLTPLLASRWLTERDAAPHRSGRVFTAIENGYARLLRWSMAHRAIVAGACVLSLVAVVPLGAVVAKDFLPKNDESQFEVKLRAPEGTSLQQTELIAGRIGQRVEQLPGVAHTVVFVADDEARTRNLGSLFVQLVEVHERRHSQHEVMAMVREQVLPQFAHEQLRSSVSPIAAISGGGKDNKDVAFYVSGPDTKQLGAYAERLTRALAAVPGAIDIDTSLILGKPELHVAIDRAKAADLGVQMADVGNTLRVLVGGDEVTDFVDGGERYEVHARSAVDHRTDVAGIAAMAVPSAKLGAVALEHVATFREESGASQIDRLGRRRQVTITANVAPGHSQQAAVEALQREAASMGMGAGYRWGVTGTSKEMANAARNFVIAFVLSFVFMYLILAAQFESWIHPVTILIALPLTVPFALLSLLLFGQSLNIYTALGLLVLFGVVKKNAILQVDHTNALRASGMTLLDATLRANRDRLRPILMTTVAFVAGMVPLLVSTGTGAGDNRAIGSVIFGGQILSLLLTLLATPVFYSLFEDVRTRFAPLAWLRGATTAIARAAGRLRLASSPARALPLLLAAAVVAGCAAPAPRQPAVPSPASWRGAMAGDDDPARSFADEGWWQLFGDERLGELIAIALAENKDLAVAAARVEEQRALVARAGAARWPSLDAVASAKSTRASRASVPALPAGVDSEGTIWKAELGASWELDLWGRLRSADEAARAELLATEWARRGVVTTLVADVGLAWFDLLEVDAELAIARRTLESRRRSLFLVQRRHDEQLASTLDLARAQAEVESAAALVPELERRAERGENRLAVLLGRNPGPIARRTALASTPVPPRVPAGLPSSLLARRPDLQEARLRLEAANARVGEAWAETFPSISLTGAFGSESGDLSDLFHGPARAWRLGPQVSMPLFDAGRRRAGVDAADARARQAVALLEQAVQQAFREVEDALVDHREVAAVAEHQAALVAHLRRAHDLADQRFREGITAQLEVLDAQRALLAAELDLARTQRDRLAAVVRLHAALGGGWQTPETIASRGRP
jgi:hydrophobic/amphiphilic exporter-1 (mainly G- bacteria), HAE1 family